MAEESAPTVTVPTPKPEAKRSARRNPQVFWGLGRRKTASARIRLIPGTGKILINERDADKYFPRDSQLSPVRHAMEVVGMLGKVDVLAKAEGGGFTGQSGAIVLGVARALVEMNPEFRKPLSKAGLLMRDSRMVERKKVGRRGARRGFQWCKR